MVERFQRVKKNPLLFTAEDLKIKKIN